MGETEPCHLGGVRHAGELDESGGEPRGRSPEDGAGWERLRVVAGGAEGVRPGDHLPEPGTDGAREALPGHAVTMEAAPTTYLEAALALA